MNELKAKFTPQKAKTGLSTAYASLIFVVLVWGCAPSVYSILFNYFSPSMCPAIIGLSSAIFLFFFSIKHLKEINKTYFLLAIPTGFFNGAASVLQKIGLQYTSDAHYAFLENLSCIVVPFLMFLFIRKKPSALKIAASIICLAGAFILNSKGSGLSLNIGDILCAIAGILYGVNIALTGSFAKNLHSSMYVMIQMFVTSAIAFATSFTLNVITIGGEPIEPIKFEFRFLPIAGLIVFGLVTNALCWIVRTRAMRKIDATVVAVIMPFSAIVTAIISVIRGSDELTPQLIFGGLFCFSAAILSGFADTLTVKYKRKKVSLK